MGAAVRCLLWQPLTRSELCTTHTLTQDKRTRETGSALFATPVSFVRKMEGSLNPSPLVKMRSRSNAEVEFLRRRLSAGVFTPFCSYRALSHWPIDITSERFISEHPPQSQIHKKLEPHTPR